MLLSSSVPGGSEPAVNKELRDLTTTFVSMSGATIHNASCCCQCTSTHLWSVNRHMQAERKRDRKEKKRDDVTGGLCDDETVTSSCSCHHILGRYQETFTCEQIYIRTAEYLQLSPLFMTPCFLQDALLLGVAVCFTLSCTTDTNSSGSQLPTRRDVLCLYVQLYMRLFSDRSIDHRPHA